MGIDIVNDGEMGKSSWITYLYERVSGLETRIVPLEGTSVLPPSRDRDAFPGFYAEHDRQLAQQNRSSIGVDDHEAIDAAPQDEKLFFCTGPIT